MHIGQVIQVEQVTDRWSKLTEIKYWLTVRWEHLEVPRVAITYPPQLHPVGTWVTTHDRYGGVIDRAATLSEICHRMHNPVTPYRL